MSASLENNCESVIILILGANTDLNGFAILHQDEDPPADQDRIVVSAKPREVELPGKEPGTVKAWRVLCSVEVFYVNRDEDDYDTVIAAVEASLNAATPPVAAQTAWTTSFPNGGSLEQTSDGTENTDSNTRNRARTFRFIVIA